MSDVPKKMLSEKKHKVPENKREVHTSSECTS